MSTKQVGSSAAAFRRAANPRTRHSQLLPKALHSHSPNPDAVVDCGWGKLLFGHTFSDKQALLSALRDEDEASRNIAFYVDDPHVLLAAAPQELFLDPSHTYRLWLAHYRNRKDSPRGFFIRRLRSQSDADAVNSILARVGMVQIPPAFLLRSRKSRAIIPLVAESDDSGAIVGTAMGVDHDRAIDDPERGSSLWSLAVDPQISPPGVGEALVRFLAEYFKTRGNSFLDLSVMHTNRAAITLYESLDFLRMPIFSLKHKNSFNEKLYIAPPPEARLNPYARIIVDEARRRGIAVNVEDEEAGLFALSFGGRTISCRESLSELTSAVALSRCDNKALTRRALKRAELNVPDQIEVASAEENKRFLKKHRRIVVKPARGEQGRGITVGVHNSRAMKDAVAVARQHCESVLLEAYHLGEDLRVIVINGKVVAAAIRKPASIEGNGVSAVSELIAKQSRKRAASTSGESKIPNDAETKRCVDEGGYTFDSILPKGEVLTVRRTANLHTGGTIHDVTDNLHPTLVAASVKAAEALGIPVVGLDLIVSSHRKPEYVIIEANERPGLANHEPQPTAERFIDLLFPQTS